MKFSLKNSLRWTVFISFVTLILAIVFSVSSTMVLSGVAWGIGMLIVLTLVMIGIVFDMLGIASTAANETPFHAMASEKVKGSRQAIGIIRNADRFSSFCNDVIGDITGIISGAASTLVIIKLILSIEGEHAALQTVLTVIFTGIVSALTVGGKAFGKSLAIHFSTDIILIVGRVFYVLENRLGIRIFNGQKKGNSGKRGKKRASRADQPT